MLLLIAALGAACDAAEDVEVQPLPDLERPSPEARAGLPQVAGVWRFAGWELAPTDSVNLRAELPGLGQIRLETQRLDSLAGFYVFAEGRVPVLGEVRRDSLVALAALTGEGEGRFIAGQVSRDTLWVSLTSLLPPEVWPDAGRAAFVRSRLETTAFRRLKGSRALPTLPLDSLGNPIQPAVDTTVVLALGTSAVPAGPWPRAAAAPAAPVAVVLAPGASAVPPGPWPRAAGTPALARSPAPSRPRETPAVEEPEPEPDTEPEPELEPEPPTPRPAPVDSPRPPPIPLLGDPVRPDTVRPDTSYSPIAATATDRPRSVSARR